MVTSICAFSNTGGSLVGAPVVPLPVVPLLVTEVPGRVGGLVDCEVGDDGFVNGVDSIGNIGDGLAGFVVAVVPG